MAPQESVPTFKSKLERPLDTTSNGKDGNPVQGMLILSAPLVGYHMVWLTENGEVSARLTARQFRMPHELGNVECGAEQAALTP